MRRQVGLVARRQRAIELMHHARSLSRSRSAAASFVHLCCSAAPLAAAGATAMAGRRCLEDGQGRAGGRARDVRDGDGDGSARVVGGSVALGGMAA